MRDQSILIGVVIFIIILYVRNYLNAPRCRREYKYFDDQFDIIPAVTTVDEEPITEGLREREVAVQPRNARRGEDLMAPRWRSSLSQHAHSDDGRVRYGFTDKPTTPVDFNPHIKNPKNKKYVQHRSKMKDMRMVPQVEKMVDGNESRDSKYMRTKGFYDPVFNDPYLLTR